MYEEYDEPFRMFQLKEWYHVIMYRVILLNLLCIHTMYDYT